MKNTDVLSRLREFAVTPAVVAPAKTGGIVLYERGSLARVAMAMIGKQEAVLLFVGTGDGNEVIEIAANTEDTKFVCVDPWIEQCGCNGECRGACRRSEFMTRCSPFGQRILLLDGQPITKLRRVAACGVEPMMVLVLQPLTLVSMCITVREVLERFPTSVVLGPTRLEGWERHASQFQDPFSRRFYAEKDYWSFGPAYYDPAEAASVE